MRNWLRHILFYIVVTMMVSLFASRTALSVCIMAFVPVCFFHRDIRGHFKNFFSSPLLWSMSLLFLLPLLSGLWSGDKKEWLNILRIKLPLFLLPLAFAAPFTFSKKQWHGLVYIFILLITAGTIWSMFHYVTHISAVQESYLHAKAILTPLENDHVRFSWLVAVAILFASWLWWHNKNKENISWLLLIVIIWLIIFLHILAVRTGLVSLYIILLAGILWIIFKEAKLLYGKGLLALVIILPVIAYFLFPTFRNKIKYFKYDFGYLKDTHYLRGGNDASRVISLKAGWSTMNSHAIKGVGFGDIHTETQKWYAINYPEMLPSDKILPSNEWLIYGAGCGIPGLLIFTWVMLVPFFTLVRCKQRWWLLNAVVAFGFLFDIGLEVQFGVFIYSFIVLAGWKWFHYKA